MSFALETKKEERSLAVVAVNGEYDVLSMKRIQGGCAPYSSFDGLGDRPLSASLSIDVVHVHVVSSVAVHIGEDSMLH